MNRKILHAVVLCLPLAVCTGALADAETAQGKKAPVPAIKAECPIEAQGNQQPRSEADPGAPATKVVTTLASTECPKVVFQINQAADAPTILRFVTNFLKAEPAARVAVVGYGGGVDFMLKGAMDAAGKPYAEQLQALVAKGVEFKACNNTLKARNQASDAVAPGVTVVPGAVNEIIRLQTREGYAYFRH